MLALPQHAEIQLSADTKYIFQRKYGKTYSNVSYKLEIRSDTYTTNVRIQCQKKKERKLFQRQYRVPVSGEVLKGKFPVHVTVVKDMHQLRINNYDTTHWCQSQVHGTVKLE